VAGADPDRFTPTADRAAATDGQRLADCLGLGYAPLLHAAGADNADNAEAVAMNRALYAGTLGYYLDHMMGEVVDAASLGALRRHFTDFVTGRGPVAAIRVGPQPYGILPTSSLGRWQPGGVRRGQQIGIVPALPDPFEAALLRALVRFDAAWMSLVPGLSTVGAPGDGAQHLLDVMGLHPNSAEFYQRVGYSFDYLQNLEAFAWGGADFADVIKMFIERMVARTLLNQLGDTGLRADGTPKPLPLLLQLIWRHYQTALDPRQLIDGQPLSESAGIRPFDGAGTTYLDWLVANASDATALEAQDFGTGVAKPTALLYMMLHFAIVMEAGRGIHRWFDARGVIADELVRSRKFLNIGAQPSPSVWEVFRAPAASLVAGAPATPLLALMAAPQLALDAGQDVQQ
jgi:hypothetical protein